jgi:peptidylprolyl isomerase
LILLLAAGGTVASAQTPATPVTKPASAAKSATATKSAAASHATAASAIKLPPGVPPVKGIRKELFALRYQDILIGSGADAEPYKIYKVRYTGWLASDGKKFDSSYDHPAAPVMDKENKPVMGEDGKPKMEAGQPIAFPAGMGRVIPGWDKGFEGMKVGGKRRLFIPYQLAYGERGRPGPDASQPGIPPKADLIFDIELVDIIDVVMPSNHLGAMPGMRSMPGMAPKPPAPASDAAAPATPTTPAQPATTPTPAAPATTPTPAAPATTPAPAAPTTPPTTPPTPPQSK